MRMPSATFHELVNVLSSRLPRLGVPAEVRTAIALRYLSGGCYIDICAGMCVHAATAHRAV